MNKLDQIKQTLFTATDYSDALAKLAAINANVTTYESYSVIDEFGIVFFATRKNKTLPMVITFDGVSPSVTIDEYYAVHAQQQPDLSQSVPAHDSLVAAGQLVIPEPSTESVDKPFGNWLARYYPKADMRKQILRTERRLKNSRVKGLSS
uniref:hypothetical protein n=1 Tax=Rheinheimera sp. TaxID=1869214 RepID=UPI004048D03D